MTRAYRRLRAYKGCDLAQVDREAQLGSAEGTAQRRETSRLGGNSLRGSSRATAAPAR